LAGIGKESTRKPRENFVNNLILKQMSGMRGDTDIFAVNE
jgi:hypothetical protein